MNILTPSTTVISSTSSLFDTNLVNSYPEWQYYVEYSMTSTYYPIIVTFNNNWYESIANSNLNNFPNSSPTKWKLLGPSLLPVSSQALIGQSYSKNDVVIYGNNYYKSLINGNIFDNSTYLDSSLWANLGFVNILRQFDTYNYTSTVGHYSIKYSLEVPNTKDSYMKALSFTGLKNASSVELEVTASEILSKNLNTNIVELTNSVYIDTIWSGRNYDTINKIGINYNTVTNSEPVNRLIDNNINTQWEQQYTDFTGVFTIKLNTPLCIRKIKFITNSTSVDNDPQYLEVIGSNDPTNIGYDSILFAQSPGFPSFRNTETNEYDLNNNNSYLYYTFLLTNGIKNIKINDIILLYDTNDPLGEFSSKQWKYVNLGIEKPTEVQYLPTATYQPILTNTYNLINLITTTGDSPVDSIEGANNLFDENTYTKWFEEQNVYSQQENRWVSIIVKLNLQWCVQKIQFVTANDAEYRDPINYAVFGSQDGIVWTLLKYESKLELPSSRNSYSDIYNLNNIEQYWYYKIIFDRSKQSPKENSNGTYEYQLSELRLLVDANDPTGYNLRIYNQFTNANVLKSSIITNTNRLVLSEIEATSKIYYMDDDFFNISNLKTATINGVPAETQLLINRLYHYPTNNKIFACGGDLAEYEANILVSEDNGITWTNINLTNSGPTIVSGTKKFLTSIAWSGTQFVVVGENGTIITSPNGINWTSRTSGVTVLLNSVVWSGTQFVAVGNNGIIITSPNGINWTSRTSGVTDQLFGITWSGSKFVAVGNNHTILTSTDGITWSIAITGIQGFLWSVTWTGSQFVAAGGGGPGTRILTSPNGATWTVRYAPGQGHSLLNISNNGNIIVAIGNYGTILISTDGITWGPAATTIGAISLSGIVWSGNKFVVTGENGTIITSPDGINWDFVTSGTIMWMNNIIWTDNQFVAVGQSGTVLKSSDSITWNILPGGITSLTPLWDITYCGGLINKFVGLGYNNEIITSTDGITWSYHSTISSMQYGALFSKIDWTDNHGGILMLPGIVQVNGQNKPGIAWTKTLVSWETYGDPDNYWYNNINCVKYNYDKFENTGYWLAAGSEAAYFGVYIDWITPEFIIWIPVTSVFFSADLQMQQGFYNDIKPYNKPFGWILCGSGKLLTETTSSGKIVSYTSAPFEPAELNLLFKDKRYNPDEFTSLLYVEEDNQYIATMRTNLVINTPIYYNKTLLDIDNSTVNKTFAIFTDGLYNKLSEYDKLYYNVSITGSANIQIGNTMLHNETLYLGNIQRGAGLSIIDYSIKNVDEFGTITLIERLTSNRVSVKILINITDINTIQSILNNIRAKPCIWSGSDLAKYQSLTLYGFYRNYEITINNPSLAILTLELESLV